MFRKTSSLDQNQRISLGLLLNANARFSALGEYLEGRLKGILGWLDRNQRETF